jgi:hypothetical protein
VLIDADDLHAAEPAGVVDQDPLALGQDRVAGSVPRNAESRSPRRDSFAPGSAARMVS